MSEVRQAVERAEAQRLRRAALQRWWLAAGVAAIVFGADQLSKVGVRGNITPGETVEVVPGVDLVHTNNRGIAFGLFPGRPGLVAVLTAITLCVIAAGLVALGRGSRAVMLGGGLLVGGAAGNLVDRLTHSGVTDFVAVASWPPFNVADVAIVAGAIVAAVALVRAPAPSP